MRWSRIVCYIAIKLVFRIFHHSVVRDLISKPCLYLIATGQWKLPDNDCKIFVKYFNFRLISAKIPQLQKSEIDDRENKNESRLFCQVRLPGESFDMVGVDFLLL